MYICIIMHVCVCVCVCVRACTHIHALMSVEVICMGIYKVVPPGGGNG